ncbi:ubiquinol-cytochrome c reductase iron-sulfur subunit [Pseudanabaena sp. 'Roaring Creek']|uniref:QcrA and Rieske domain-containing protein n=1 Tax=Pseudanabaena sp. 'Roaring Creek' TaxID=1681830 RepID=UPI0006D7C25C|nr:Rieske 2Fe-2S domain-containing protein [Pseudanabaena sp. 'Roaring Creek']
MERRKFLMLFGVGTLASYLPVAIAACSSLFKVDEAFGQSDGAVVAGTIADLDNAGQLYQDNTSIGSIAVIRSPDNPQKLLAVDPTCTHQGCTVNWDNDKKQFKCPCHGAKFNANGKVLKGPASSSLGTYNAKIQGDSVIVSKN